MIVFYSIVNIFFDTRLDASDFLFDMEVLMNGFYAENVFYERSFIVPFVFHFVTINTIDQV
jgi:hypothetical protein